MKMYIEPQITIERIDPTVLMDEASLVLKTSGTNQDSGLVQQRPRQTPAF